MFYSKHRSDATSSIGAHCLKHKRQFKVSRLQPDSIGWKHLINSLPFNEVRVKTNLPVTTTEKQLRDSTAIISTTNLKGMIESINQDFLDISGFNETELIDKAHNIVRHPDVPPAAFGNLWESLKAGKSWMGIVKNRCKNGDYYWVDAYVAPIYENEQVIGYQSVRTKLSAEDCTRAARLYTEISSGKFPRFRLRDLGIKLQTFIGISGVLAAVLAGLMLSEKVPSLLTGVAFLVGLPAAYIVATWITQPIVRAAQSSRSIVDNKLTQYLYFDAANEITQLQTAQRILQARLKVAGGRITEYASKLDHAAHATATIAEQTSQGIRQHQSETDQVATAINEMSATVQEVARNANAAAVATQNANTQAGHGQTIVIETISAIERLAQEVEKAAGVIQQLEQDSDRIGSVVDVIKTIAEQTNLLALNAAIEAARAGEQGRGFAVVADEVRTLASRTSQSTQEIQHMIEELQTTARNAVKVMEDGRNQAGNGVKQVTRAGEALTEITQAIGTISTMNDQIAAASEQQSAVAEEINKNIVNITRVVDATADGAQQTANAGQDLLNLAERLKVLVKQCCH
ncbi:MAG: methyl-accepting chemotaxis protein [Gammaproteobacteria bacterium]|nr:methyl-accepting chemotaxis protein [Gammaproteobacteria bacterium]